MNANSLKESDVIEWMRAVSAASGVDDLSLEITTLHTEGLQCTAVIRDRGELHCGMSGTLTGAIAKAQEKFGTPHERAAKAREEINRLLVIATESEFEADRLEELRTEAKRHQPKPSIHE